MAGPDWQTTALLVQIPNRGPRQGCGLPTNGGVRRCWWRMTGSNRRPPACKAGALPAELIPQDLSILVVGLAGFEPATPALSRRCSNRLSYRPTHSLRAPVRANQQGQLARLTRFLTHCCVTTADKCGRAELAMWTRLSQATEVTWRSRHSLERR